MRKFFLILMIFGIGALLANGWGGGRMMVRATATTTNEKTEDLQRVEVWLAESVEKVKGIDWFRGDNGQPLMMTVIQEPAYFVIHLPSGKVLESFTMGATMNNDDGYVSKVVLQPLPELARSYNEVINAAEALVERWDIGNPELDASLAAWRGMYEKDPLLIPPEERGLSPKLYANAEIEPDIWLSPERDIHDSNKGWYLQMNLWAGNAIARKLGKEIY